MVVPRGIQPHDELLLCLLQAKPDHQTCERIAALSSGDFDWTGLVHRAAHHKILSLVYHRSQQTLAKIAPEVILKVFAYQYQTIARQNLVLVNELIKIVNYLRQRGISVIPYKGPALAVLAYQNVGLRQFSDLDLLADPRDYLQAIDALCDFGYRVKKEFPWEASLVNQKQSIKIDLHRDLAHRKFPFRVNFCSSWQRTQTVSVGGGQIKTFNNEDMLIVLCIQLLKDSWSSTPPLHLSKVCDICELLNSHRQINWTGLLEESTRLGCRTIVLTGLACVRNLFAVSLPEAVNRMVDQQTESDLLGRQVIDQRLFQLADDSVVESLSAEQLHFNVRERWRDRLYPYYYVAIHPFMPSDKDRRLVKLPESLGMLYFLVRSFRLTKKFCRLTWRRLRQKFAISGN